MLSHFICVRIFVTLWTVAHQVALFMGFSRQEYWSGLPFPSPGDLPDPGIEPPSLISSALAGSFFTTGATWEALHERHWFVIFSLVLQRLYEGFVLRLCHPAPWQHEVFPLSSILRKSLYKFGTSPFNVWSFPFSHLVVSDSLQSHGLKHARLPCPSPTFGACSNPCPSSQWCHPTISSSVTPFSSCLQSFPNIRVFSNELVLHIRWPKYWSFSFSISPSDEYSGLISFRIDWFDLLAVQGTLKSLLQHHSSKASILQHSAFFIV